MPSGELGVNTYLAVDEATKKGFIVDPGGYNPALTAAVNAENIDIQYIILTHGHSDHICGVNEHIKDFPGAKVVAYADELTMLKDPAMNMSVYFGMNYTVEPDILINDNDILQVGNLDLQFIHTPGHTVGGMCIYVKSENVLFSGDTLFHYSIGRSDFYGGDYRTMINSIKDVLFYLPDDTVLLPGHMEISTIGNEKRGNPFV
jgi:glyoxylase-like metal-dependent hydrolase (beta-lactamase superfamily II)